MDSARSPQRVRTTSGRPADAAWPPSVVGPPEGLLHADGRLAATPEIAHLLLDVNQQAPSAIRKGPRTAVHELSAAQELDREG